MLMINLCCARQMNVIIPPTPQLPPQATCVPQICRCSKLTPVCSKMTLNGRFPMCSKMTLIRCSKMTLVPKEEGSQEAKSLLSFQPCSSKDCHIGRELRSWLKSPPMIKGPGHEEVAVRLVLQVISSLPVQQFRLFVIGLWVTIN